MAQMSRFGKLPQLLILLLLHLSVFASAGTIAGRNGAKNSRQAACTNPIIRKEWRTLTQEEQLDYLSAVKCFLEKPGLTPASVAPGAVSRYEDLVVTHIQQTMDIHFVGHFLPWHRWFTAVYEKGLREECGYKGAQPYWDWTLDVNPPSNWAKSPVFDPVYGFGGNGAFVESNGPNDVPGRTGGGCVADGPFKDMVIRLGPMDDLSGNPRCLHRDLSPYFAGRYLGMNQTILTISQPDFGQFTRVNDGGPSFDDSGLHGGGHYSVGGTFGEMGDLYASPSDPIFYMHHTNLDRVWWSWQSRDLQNRLTDISGPQMLMDYENLQAGNVTLDFKMSVGLNAEDVTVRDTMDIRGGYLCYDYDSLY
ncbi:hypothetical protein AJ80_05417 [Polytolypa hystricis UAMH7299]|uniref:Tyrosinase copper-binding domain-containing protein n=1 Tax=Polytolypa hystricis (strain UAMH7299) TaxID=1447883 RepID=A0A2B7Y3U7_POLH7|nr:hypothetical protein AJ80_05417 [Polytolypa hystricis UAMH7299]